jgi:hypothetical protein
LPTWKQRDHCDHDAGQKAQHRDRLQRVEQRNQDALGLGVMGGDVTVDQRDDQADGVCHGEARDRKQRVTRQRAGVEVDDGLRIHRAGPISGQRKEAVEETEPGEEDG